MLQANALNRGHGSERTDLIHDEVFNVARRHPHLAPAETGEIRKTRMCADRDAVGTRERDRCAHDTGVAGVESASDIS